MSIKLSKKQLKELAISLEAINLKGNIYSYRNDLCDISSLKHDLTIDLKNKGFNCAGFQEIAYSIGMYGVTGYIHQIYTYQNDKKQILFYVYF